MLIIADENIPAVTEAFAAFGQIQTLQGRKMQATDIRQAGLLLVRSVTRVNRQLLDGSRVQFVGSTTIGTDHIDLSWLRSKDIAFANAPGCNAVSAAEYVIAAVLRCASDRRLELAHKTIGIIGCGNVGSRVQARFQAMGLQCHICDPPRAEREGNTGFVDMQTIATADIITIHVPLEKKGKHPTHRMIDKAFIDSLPSGTILINTSRGDIMDEKALKKRLLEHNDIHAILDVWQNEPDIDAGLAAKAAIATPHIAGYSMDGKLRATGLIYEAWCRLSHAAPTWDYRQKLPAPPQQQLNLHNIASPLQAIAATLPAAYDISHDDHNLRNLLSDPDKDTATGFDQLRKNYRIRRECAAYRITGRNLSETAISALSAFDFATT